MKTRNWSVVALARFRPIVKRRVISLTLVAILFGLTQCSKTPERQITVTRLSNNFEPLRAQFNRDAGKVRLLLLLDPT